MPNPLALMGAMPTIDGFAPLPSATADAFMSMQGGHMALYFGSYFAFSKRLVAAQSNEQFNEMVDNPELLPNMLKPHEDAIVKAFKNHVSKHSKEIQQIVMERAYDLEILKANLNYKLLLDLPKEYFTLLGESIAKTVDPTFQRVNNAPYNPAEDPNLDPNKFQDPKGLYDSTAPRNVASGGDPAQAGVTQQKSYTFNYPNVAYSYTNWVSSSNTVKSSAVQMLRFEGTQEQAQAKVNQMVKQINSTLATWERNQSKGYQYEALAKVIAWDLARFTEAFYKATRIRLKGTAQSIAR